MKISTGRLRDLIDKAGFNFAEFSREVNVSKEAMRIYTDRKVKAAPIRPEVLRRIADRLSVPFDDLRVKEDNGEALDPLAELEAHAERLGVSPEQVVAHFNKVAKRPKASLFRAGAIPLKPQPEGE